MAPIHRLGERSSGPIQSVTGPGGRFKCCLNEHNGERVFVGTPYVACICTKGKIARCFNCIARAARKACGSLYDAVELRPSEASKLYK
jgi:hypothetical protein